MLMAWALDTPALLNLEANALSDVLHGVEVFLNPWCEGTAADHRLFAQRAVNVVFGSGAIPPRVAAFTERGGGLAASNNTYERHELTAEDSVFTNSSFACKAPDATAAIARTRTDEFLSAYASPAFRLPHLRLPRKPDPVGGHVRFYKELHCRKVLFPLAFAVRVPGVTGGVAFWRIVPES